MIPAICRKLIAIVFFGLVIVQMSVGVVYAQDQSLPTEERIISFVSDIVVQPNGSLFVTEHITVYAAGLTIRHGIFRDFPIAYTNKWGVQSSVDFKVKEILVNGESEEYTTENFGSATRIKIGKKDVFLQPGIYTYTITYEVARALGFFEEYDELYWNVTGNNWRYAIDQARVRVTLPEGIAVNDVEIFGYTGVSGSKGSAYTVTATDEEISANSTQILQPGEGFTVSVSWPKGFVIEPSELQVARYFLDDNRGILFGLCVLLVMSIYYFYLWRRYGRENYRNSIVAQYEPPKGMSPAEVRYLLEWRYDKVCLVANILDLAVKGYIKIEKKEPYHTLSALQDDYSQLLDDDISKIILEKLYKNNRVVELKWNSKTIYTLSALQDDYSQLLDDDISKIILETLFKNKRVIELKGYTSAIANAQDKLIDWLTKKYQKNYFDDNSTHLTKVAMFSFLSLVIIFLIDFTDYIFITVLALLPLLAITLLSTTPSHVRYIKTIFDSRGYASVSLIKRLRIVFILLCILLLSVGLFFVAYQFLNSGLLFIIAFAFMLLYVVYAYLFNQYTETGQELVDYIMGFKMFLLVTEKERMNFHNPPERTPELFEKYLPFALVLGVENQWAENFADVFAEQDMNNRTLVMYSNSTGKFRFSDDFSRSFSASVTAASYRRSSSTNNSWGGSSGGRSGGGSSGGGRGGGGGGGW